MGFTYNGFVHHVFASRIIRESNQQLPLSQLQIQLTINFTLTFRCLDCADSFPIPDQETVTFDLTLLNQRDGILRLLAPAFTSVGISSDSHEMLTYTIIQRGLEISFNSGLNCKVLHLESVIEAFVDVSESCLELIKSRVLEGFETYHYGTVPVRVEDGEEGFKVGSYAARMPCSHAFHPKCIGKWLHLSHCCPLCPFELP
ncbi:hypothetical protein F3Y22_tig00110198pilonHSYRG00105 [Hibiscus syriacus]|uniref:RING-type E3 ubiquitin transferase n=1 Tax=Hibiscus syriacus TaxID=106335 RepID=A0A6A3BBH1_HIBSY|nr:hypothetical protein F3Y22_tig00110198pilonHSYRG00105 [Hibiscus syriacus]